MSKGFTLVELLLVFAILSIIMGGVIWVVDPSKRIAEARDAERLTHMHIITQALDQYYVYHKGEFPPSGSADSCCGDWDQGPCEEDSTFINALVEAGFLKIVPVDPRPDRLQVCYGYAYYRYEPGSEGCDFSRGAFYVLGVRDMESSNGPHPDSSGWSCPNRNWQEEFDWVSGGFEK